MPRHDNLCLIRKSQLIQQPLVSLGINFDIIQFIEFNSFIDGRKVFLTIIAHIEVFFNSSAFGRIKFLAQAVANVVHNFSARNVFNFHVETLYPIHFLKRLSLYGASI
jgi:hypothetical protein